MSAYETWREVAGIWGTLYFLAIFIVVMIYALMPSKQKDFDEAAQIPLSED